MVQPESVQRYYAEHEPTVISERIIAESAFTVYAVYDLIRGPSRIQHWQRRVEDAFWLAEHEVRNNHSLLVHDLPHELLQQALTELELEAEDRHGVFQHVAHNMLMCRAVYEWLCSAGRKDDDETFDHVINQQLTAATESLATRYEQHEQTQAALFACVESYQESHLGLAGHLYEGLTIAMIAENQQCRDAKIFALPASSELERGSKENTGPVDVALWQLQSDGSVKLVGGLQCRQSRRGANRLMANGFTAVVAPQKIPSSIQNRVQMRAIGQWLRQHRLEDMHDYLFYCIDQSQNESLKTALGISDSQVEAPSRG